MTRYLIKSSGQREAFSSKKFKRGLRKAGVQEAIIDRLIADILSDPTLTTTKKIYTYVYEQLKGVDRPLAARYSLKRALYDLGPTGFGFERFIGELFKAQGYSTKIDLIVQGVCVDHEVDLIIERDGKRSMIECKFHNRPGTKTDVRDALYTKARFEDLSAKWSLSVRPELACDTVWLVTNTQFTTKATSYGACAHVTLLGWNYPHEAGIAHLIDSLHLHPITSLTGLTKAHKRYLINKNILLCQELLRQPEHLMRLNLTPLEQQLILDECKALSRGIVSQEN